jgi:transcriptional regulator with XRE-family HTH domain
VGVAPQRVSDFEQGIRHPSPEQIAILAQILGPEIFADNLATKTIRRVDIEEFVRERTAPVRRGAR